MPLAQIRRGLLKWYDEHHRVLPWRRNFHSKRPSQEGDLPGAPPDLPLDEFMYYVMVCEVSLGHSHHLPKVTGRRQALKCLLWSACLKGMQQSESDEDMAI